MATDLISDNKESMLEFVDQLRQRIERNEILQLCICFEDLQGYDAQWTASEDYWGIAGFTVGAALIRMGFLNDKKGTKL